MLCQTLVSDSVIFSCDNCDDGSIHRLELFVGDGFGLAPSEGRHACHGFSDRRSRKDV